MYRTIGSQKFSTPESALKSRILLDMLLIFFGSLIIFALLIYLNASEALLGFVQAHQGWYSHEIIIATVFFVATSSFCAAARVSDYQAKLGAADELRREAERYRLAARYGQIDVWELGRGQDGTWQAFGGTRIGAFYGFRNCSPSELARKWLENAVENKVDAERTVAGIMQGNLEIFSLVHSLTNADGDLRWIKTDGWRVSPKGDPAVRYIGIFTDITSQHEGQEALRLTQHAVDTSTQSITMFDVEGKFTYVNDAFLKLWGYDDASEVLGKSALELFSHHEWAEQAFQELQVKGEWSGDGWGRRQDGSEIFVEGSASAVRNKETGEPIAYLWATRDITERRKEQEALVIAQAGLDSSPLSVALFDNNESITYVNEAFLEMWGYADKNQVIGLSATSTDFWPDPDTVKAIQIQLQERGTWSGETRGTRTDGREIDIHMVANIVRDQTTGEPLAMMAFSEDITEQKMLEEHLRQSQKMEALGQLTGGVAHDFNNLLGVMLGNAQLLRKKIGESKYLAAIERASQRGAELTQRLLAFSRTQTLAPQSIDLAELTGGLHDLLRRTLGEQIKIVTDVPEGAWPVMADPGQLENALLNLSINARDAMGDGGTLEIACLNIELQDGNMRVSNEVAAGDYVQIAVRDTGAGMPEDVLERVFEPFYTTKDVGEGTGLGLSMVHGFARQSGGDVVIESAPGKGTEVSLFLPRAAANVASDEPKQEAELKRGRGETILILEDDPDVRSLAVDALEELGYRVLEAADANAALQALAKEADNINLLLSDVVLPGGISGPELAAKAKDLDPNLKVMFMSGYTAGRDTSNKIPDFAETLLTKPFDLTDLAGAVRNALAA